MDAKFIKNFNYQNREILKDEMNFAKAITIRYKMSNTKNKDFVNFLLIDINEIKQFYDIDVLEKELNNLGFAFAEIPDKKFFGIIQINEKRKLNKSKVFTVKQFFF